MSIFYDTSKHGDCFINFILNKISLMLIFSDKCDKNYCQHGGTCDKSIPSQPTCSCTGIWTGETCTERYGKQYPSTPNPNISVPRVRVIRCKK